MSRFLSLLDRTTPWLIVFLMCAASFHLALKSSADVAWTNLYDGWRDVGVAQSMLDGRYPEDNVYRGETQWYNPLTGALVALGSRITGLTPNIVDARMGAYVNLIIPLSFFLLASCLVGRWAACVSLVFLMMGFPRERNLWTFTTYSPWLLAPHVGQAFLLLAISCYWKARREGRNLWYATVGLLWGLTFLTHTAPAVILGLVLVMMSFVCNRHGDGEEPVRPLWRTVWLPSLAAAAIAFIVSLPYSYPILAHYRFHVVNTGPSLFCDSALFLTRLPQALWQAASVSNAVAILGLVALVRSRQRALEKRIVLSWLAVCLAFIVYGYLGQLVNGTVEAAPEWLKTLQNAMPQRFRPPGGHFGQLLPAHHFLLSLFCVKAILVGYGAFSAVRYPFERLLRGDGDDERLRFQVLRKLSLPVSSLICVVFLACAYYPTYRNWVEFTKTVLPETYNAEFQYTDPAYRWILENTTPDDVFLCNSNASLQTVAPAARKLLVAYVIFSNPYVDYLSRFEDSKKMLDSLVKGDEAQFRAVAGKYGVSFVMLDERSEPVCKESVPFLEQVLRSGPLTVYRIRT